MQPPIPPTPFPPVPQQQPERRRYGAIAAIVLSFFSADLYRDIGRRWRGIGFWYLVFLMFITAVPLAIKAHIGFSNFARTDAQSIISTFPSLTLKKGVVTSNPDPYIWTEPGTNQPILYVDTSGAFDLPNGKNAVAKLSDKKLTVRKSAAETQVYDLAQFPDMTVDKTILAHWVDVARVWIGPAVLLFMFFFPLIWHLIQALIYGLAGMIFCSIFNVKLDYAALLRLAIVALTPAMLIDCILTIAGVGVPCGGLLYFAIEMAFLGFAVKANGADRATPPGGFPITWSAPPAAYPPPQPGGYGAPPPGQYPQ